MPVAPINDTPSNVTCPQPLTPPPEAEESQAETGRAAGPAFVVDDRTINNVEDDNTTGGMSIVQDCTMYDDRDKASAIHVERACSMQTPPSETFVIESPRNITPSETPIPQEANIGINHIINTGNMPDAIFKSNIAASGGGQDGYATASISLSTTEMTTEDHEITGEVEDVTAEQAHEQNSRPYQAGPSEDMDSSQVAGEADLRRRLSHPRRNGAARSTVTRDPALTWDFSHMRLNDHAPSSTLRPGSRFAGSQQSDRQIYKVEVTVLTTSVPESTMTGYLRIEGLTEDHPTLTTFFTGEIIGAPYAGAPAKYTFQTKHPSWGATDKTDLQHWARFPAWRPLSREAKRDINFTYPRPQSPWPTDLFSSTTSPACPRKQHCQSGTGADSVTIKEDGIRGQGWWQRENIFMRWKEWFLVPDHRVRSIQGASFEGFYYICFNQVERKISGIYFHARSER